MKGREKITFLIKYLSYRHAPTDPKSKKDMNFNKKRSA